MNNPDQYHALSTPFASPSAADEALRQFFAAVEAARVEFSIADVSVIAQVSIDHGASSRHGMASAYYGDPMTHKLALLARAYGAARQEHEEILGELIAAGRQSVKERR